jgi:hypothetical protein
MTNESSLDGHGASRAGWVAFIGPLDEVARARAQNRLVRRPSMVVSREGKKKVVVW